MLNFISNIFTVKSFFYQIDEKKVSHISAVIMLRRSDKQADRVEISPEQLSAASIKAEVSFEWLSFGRYYIQIYVRDIYSR